MGKLRAYGNAIVPDVAAAFIRAYMDLSRLPGARVAGPAAGHSRAGGILADRRVGGDGSVRHA